MSGSQISAAEAQLIARYHSLRKCVTCPICLDLFREPHALATCQHSFCRKCILSALNKKHVCPVCSQPAETSQPISIYKFNEALDLYRRILTMLERILDSKDSQTAEPASVPDVAEAPVQMDIDIPQTAPAHDLIIITHDNNHQAEKTKMEPAEDDIQPSPPLSIQPLLLFHVGDLVNVLPRTWANINKLGGVGRIEDSKQTNLDPPHDILYRVKYVLDGRVDDDIPSVFVEPFVDLPRGRRRGRQLSPSRILFAEEEYGDRGSTHDSSSHKRGRHSFPPSQQSTKSNTNSTSKSPPAATTGAAITLSHRNLDQLTGKSSSKQSSFHHAVADPKGGSIRSEQHVVDKENNVNGSTSSAPAAIRMSSSSRPDAANRSGSNGGLSRHTPPFVILTTALDDNVTAPVNKALDTLCLQYPETVIIEHGFMNTTSNLPITHLVVSCDKHGIVNQRTMKFLRALAAGLWIVNDRWLLQSAKEGRLIEETSFEVKGCSKGDVSLPHAPRRARLAHLSNDRNAFPLHGHCILLDGPFPLPGPARSDLEALVIGLGGLVYTNRHPFFIAAAGRKSIIIRSNITPGVTVQASQPDGEDSQQVKSEEDEHRLRRSKIPFVTFFWLLDCVTNFAWSSPDSFLL